ncbi:hypothetical protein BC829DRAFT_156286 [Chytridium lagenaria]|nr:hypothetical protein BC829DRAFT_156286 [Chytridium lagenaria]
METDATTLKGGPEMHTWVDAEGKPMDPLSKQASGKTRLCFEELPARHPAASIPIRVVTLEEEEEKELAEKLEKEQNGSLIPDDDDEGVEGDEGESSLLDVAMQKYVTEEMSTPMPLARGPLARLTVVAKRSDPKLVRVIFTLAHCAFDATVAVEILRSWVSLVYGLRLPSSPISSTPPPTVTEALAPPAAPVQLVRRASGGSETSETATLIGDHSTKQSHTIHLPSPPQTPSPPPLVQVPHQTSTAHSLPPPQTTPHLSSPHLHPIPFTRVPYNLLHQPKILRVHPPHLLVNHLPPQRHQRSRPMGKIRTHL